MEDPLLLRVTMVTLSSDTIKEDIFVGEDCHIIPIKTFRMEFIFYILDELGKGRVRKDRKACKELQRKFGLQIH